MKESLNIDIINNRKIRKKGVNTNFPFIQVELHM